MRFKVDENLPVEVSAWLRAAGHYALTVPDQHLGGSTDLTIASICQQEARALVTLDDLAISKAHYFGFSMGAKNGFAFAAYVPERLRSLIVLGTGASAQDHAPLDRWIAALRQGPLSSRVIIVRWRCRFKKEMQ